MPALALGFLPLWALTAEWAVIAYAGMAAALLVYRRSPLLVSWMPEWVGLAIASAWWIVGSRRGARGDRAGERPRRRLEPAR